MNFADWNVLCVYNSKGKGLDDCCLISSEKNYQKSCSCLNSSTREEKILKVVSIFPAKGWKGNEASLNATDQGWKLVNHKHLWIPDIYV